MFAPFAACSQQVSGIYEWYRFGRVTRFKFIVTLSLCLSVAIPASSQNITPRMSGQISFSPIFTMGDMPTYGIEPSDLDFTSNSRLTLDYGAAKFNFLVMKPSTWVRPGQPEQYYTAELLVKGQTLRYGDLTPRFTDNITGFARVHGGEVRLAYDRFVSLQLVHGTSQRAMPSAGFQRGTYHQAFSGARVTVSPLRAVSLGISGARMGEDPTSTEFTSGFSAPAARDNLVVGSDLTLRFLKRRRASLQLEYAASLYTQDRTASDSLGFIRGETLSPASLAETGLARRFVTINDSSRVGNLIATRLVVPLKYTRTTVEYRRSSPNYMTLATPWGQRAQTRIRLQQTAQLFDRAVSISASGDYTTMDAVRVNTFGMRTVNGFTNVTFNQTPAGRVTIGLRANQRTNDAPPPEDGRADRRIAATMIAPSLSVTREVAMWGMPVNGTVTLSGTRYADSFRPTSNYHTLGVQFRGETRSEGPLHVEGHGRFAHTKREATGAMRWSAELQLQEGYDLFDRRLHVYVVQGIGTDYSSDGWQHQSRLTYGGGGRWTASPTSTVELEWQSRQMLDYVFENNNYGHHTLELRLTYRW